MSDPIRKLVGEPVVLDTAKPIVYLGRLVEVTDSVFVLEDADLHDCRDGHAGKEEYIAQAHEDKVSVNRRRVVVMRSSVMSLSRLADVVIELGERNGDGPAPCGVP